MCSNIESDAKRIQNTSTPPPPPSPPTNVLFEEHPQLLTNRFYDNHRDFYYKMNHPNRGIAIIFNHKNFERHLRLSRRRGTNRDCARLTNCFKSLGFETQIYNDFKYEEISRKLSEISKYDHSNNDCLWICVLTHGQDSSLYAKDCTYKIDNLINYLKPNNCKTLAGKPKILTFQACQGQRTDIGYPVSLIRRDSNRMLQQYNIPTTADFILCHSSSPGYISYRHPRQGSWYIKELCKQLETNAYNYDFYALLTQVAQNVAFQYRTTTLEVFQRCFRINRTHEQQMPYFTSTLTRILQFQPKNS